MAVALALKELQHLAVLHCRCENDPYVYSGSAWAAPSCSMSPPTGALDRGEALMPQACLGARSKPIP